MNNGTFLFNSDKKSLLTFLDDITEDEIVSICDYKIFLRGVEYYDRKLVKNVSYSHDQNKLKATVKGGENYVVEIFEQNNEILGSCTCLYDSLHIVRALLDKGVDVNARSEGGRTLLMAAAYCGNIGILKLAIISNAVVDALDLEGNSALVIACGVGPRDNLEEILKGNTEVINHLDEYSVCVRALLDSGANPDTTDSEGNTPLMLAADLSDLAMVKEVLKRDVDLNKKNKYGWTALMYASYPTSVSDNFRVKEVIQIITRLLNKGADVNARNNDDKTALDLALSRNKHSEIVDLLISTPFLSSGSTVKDNQPNIHDTEQMTLF